MIRVDFLGIGVQKAGTTWLHRMLRAHPEVFVAEGEDKDTRFFSHFYDHGYEWYAQHFQGSEAALKRGEISTSYFYSKDAPQRVRAFNPGMRLLLCLRNPIDRLVSNHRHEVRIGHATGRNAILEEGIVNNPSYIEQSMYYTQLARWLDVFPLESFHIMIFEELFADPRRALREVYSFIGVNGLFEPEGMEQKINEGRIPRSTEVDRKLKRASQGLRRVGLGWAVDAMRDAGLRKAVRSANTRGEPAAAQLQPDTRQMLQDLFRDENERLARLLGRDSPIWGP